MKDEKFTSPTNQVLQDTDEDTKDDISLLLDNVPELDEMFGILRRIGYGTFSSVYLAKSKQENTTSGSKYFAIKHIIPTSHPSRVYMELKCLKMMGGEDNVIKVVMCIRQLNHIVLVMPYFPHDKFKEYVGQLPEEELKSYIKNLLLAVRRVHSFNIIHRDIKPANFLYSRKHRRYALVDFGLAQDTSDKKLNPTSDIEEQSKKTSHSSKIFETPQSSTHKTVKRKLSVLDTPDRTISTSKKPRHVSPPSVSLKSILLSLSSNTETGQVLRRSPRKSSASTLPCRKDNNSISIKKKSIDLSPEFNNYISKNLVNKGGNADTNLQQKNTRTENILLQDSPSKNTRKADLQKMKVHQKNDKNSLHARVSSTNTALSRKHSDSNKVTYSGKTLEQVQTKSGKLILRPASCGCYGYAKVCSTCLGRNHQVASRAGTPGFRAPEVLMTYPQQSTALDIWSVGVTLLSLVSGCYPFFKATEDLECLSEITTLLGTASIKKAAAAMNKLFICSEELPALDILKLCNILRNGYQDDVEKENKQDCLGCKQQSLCICLNTSTNQQNVKHTRKSETNSNISCNDALSSKLKKSKLGKCKIIYSSSVYNLLRRLLDPNPITRITADDALDHPFFKTS